MGSLVALAGCSGSGTEPDDAPASAATGSAAAPTPAAPASSPATSPATGSPSLETLPADRCLSGDWRLVRFVGATDQTYGTGQGGDLTVRFGDGGYTLQGAGREPVVVTLAGRSADLTVDGRAAGTFTVDGGTATFTQQSATGGARLGTGSSAQRLTMDQVTQVVGLTGEGQVACTADAMTVTLAAVRLELGRT